MTKKIRKERKQIIRISTNILEKNVDIAEVKMEANAIVVTEAVPAVKIMDKKVASNSLRLTETSLVQSIQEKNISGKIVSRILEVLTSNFKGSYQQEQQQEQQQQ